MAISTQGIEPGFNLKQLGGWLFDFLILASLGIWIFGGISLGGHLYLKHGADLRRGGIILGFSGAYFFPQVCLKSYSLRWVFAFGHALEKSVFRWTVLFLVMGFASALAVFQTLALRVPLYDVGIFHQILWSLSHGLGFFSSISKAGNFLHDHFSPSLALFLPFFKLSGESPYFLPVVQSILIFGGGAAWIYLAERVPCVTSDFRSKLAAGTTVFILGFDSLWGNLRWGFHENAIAFFSWSWAIALYFSEEGNKNWALTKQGLVWVLLLVTAFSKEILLPDISFMLWVWVFQKKTSFKGFRLAGVVLAVALLWGFILFERMPHPADKNYFDRYYSYLGNDVSGIFHSIFQAPKLVLENIGMVELCRYFWVVFSPWLFLPLLGSMAGKGKRNFWLLAIVPSFASAALSSFPLLRRSNFHYVLELWPILAGMTVVYLAQKRSEKLVWAWALFSLLRWDHDPIQDFREYGRKVQTAGEVRNFFRSIPRDAAVAADDLAGPWVASRKNISRWPDLSLLPGQCPDYIILHNSSPDDQALQTVVKRCVLKTGVLRSQQAMSSQFKDWKVIKIPQESGSHLRLFPPID